jgi:hypothetical protein
MVFGLVMLLLFSRSPSLLTHAQFYAEDGMFWFAQAYNGGWLHSLTVPEVGYLNSMPRLAAGLALLVPLQWAPLVMATVGLIIQGLPVPILLSPRLRQWGPLPTRMLLAAIYVALPNAKEIQIVATNTQWHLALASVLVALAGSPRTRYGRVFDIVLLLASSFSGPFCIVLAPLVLLFWWLRRQPWSLVIFSLVSVAACVQIFLVLHTAPRMQNALGATPGNFLRLLGGNIVACALFGRFAFALKAPMAPLVAAAVLGLIIYLYCLRFASLEWKLFLVYCAGLYAAELRSPLVVGTGPVWDILLNNVSGRYWFFPMLAFLWSAAWCALNGRDRLFKLAGTCILFTMSFGIIRDWSYAPYPDERFAISVERMREAKAGEHVIVPIPPAGWSMELVKRGS